MRREIVDYGYAGAIPVTLDELYALRLKIGDQVEVTSVGGVIEIAPVDKFSDLKLEQLLELVDSKV